MVVLSGVTLLAMSMIFQPLNWWPVAYVALVPWLVAVCTSKRPTWLYAISYAMGVGFFLVNVRWLAVVTVPGYVALSCYLGAYFPLVAWPVRHMYLRWQASVAVVFAVVWTASEYLRGWVMTGFPWFFLSHSHASVLTMIQVSDLVGAWGVSFLIAMVNGWICDLMVQPILIWREGRPARGHFPYGTAVMALLLVATVLYGRWQLSRDTLRPGPTAAVLQRVYPQYVGLKLTPEYLQKTFSAYEAMSRDAASQRALDLLVWPETAVMASLSREWRDPASHRRLVALANQTGATVATGAYSMAKQPDGQWQAYNSAYVYAPPADGSLLSEHVEPGRYDKMHLVVFGEMIPFAHSRSSTLRWVSRQLRHVMPAGYPGGSLLPGKRAVVFAMPGPDPQTGESVSYRFSTPICFEDVMPDVCRRFVNARRPEDRAQFLLNLSNDGWFVKRNPDGSLRATAELPQHLAISVFRAVENRVAMARAVNTGCSALIDPNGRIRQQLDPLVVGTLVDSIPIDRRVAQTPTLYARWGDWMALACLGLGGLMLVDAVVWARSHRGKGAQP